MKFNNTHNILLILFSLLLAFLLYIYWPMQEQNAYETIVNREAMLYVRNA